MTCPRCGAPWPAGAWQCTNCGLVAQGSPQPWGPTAQPAPRRGPGAVGWVAIVLALLLVVGGMAAGTAWYVDRQGEPQSAPAVPPASSDPPPDTTRTAAPPPTDTTGSYPVPSKSPPPTADSSDFSGTYARVESGVVRILASTCEGDGIGTGFVTDRHTVATAAHVVDGAGAVAIEAAERTFPATVTGVDPATDLALLHVDAPLQGHVFDLAATDPTPGTQVAAIGFPLNEPKTLTTGTVSGLDRTIRIEGTSRSGLLQTDVAINPGNSGGPLVTADGAVVGVVDAKRLRSQGIGYAVQVSVAQPALEQEIGMQQPFQPACTATEGPARLSVAPRLLVPSDVTASEVRDTLATYFDAINTGRYERMVQQYSPRSRPASTPVPSPPTCPPASTSPSWSASCPGTWAEPRPGSRS